MGHVKDTYIQYEAASDHYAGRIVAGLNVNSHKFSVSPPFFLSTETDFTLVRDDIHAAFPFVVDIRYEQILKFCLASLMNSKNWLLEHLGIHCALRRNICLRDFGPQLKTPFVCIRTKYSSDEIEPDLRLTGIPPHVLLLSRIEEYQRKNEAESENQKAFIGEAISTLGENIRADLDTRSIGGGQFTPDNFKELLKPLESIVLEMKNQPAQPTALVQEAPTLEPSERRKRSWNIWSNGCIRQLPENYVINREMPLLIAWQLWHHGDDIAPPLKQIRNEDLCDNRMVKGRLRPKRPAEVRALNNLRFVCRRLDEAANIGQTRTRSMEELVALYSSEALKHVLPREKTMHNRLRRADELNWTHACKVMKAEMKIPEA